MKEFREKVAVITGAASGIGRALADRCIREQMKVVLADIEESALEQASRELKSIGGRVLPVRTDVTKPADIESLAKKTLEAFGAVHLLFNNAGVGAGGPVWESTLQDWQWVLGVNLWGIIHGIRTFVPIMLAQDTECHIVNTASLAGLLHYHPSSPYQVSKFAAVGLSENLYFSLKQMNAKVKASVLCPGWVKTRIMYSERNRPEELKNTPSDAPIPPEAIAVFQSMFQAVETGLAAEQIAEAVFTAIQNEQFYIIVPTTWNPMIQTRSENILQQRNPE